MHIHIRGFDVDALKRKGALAIALAMAGVSLLATHPVAAQRAEDGKIEADGTIVANQVKLPVSVFVSDAFKKAYIDYEASVQNWPIMPPLDAPKADWDKFDAAADKRIYGPGYEISKKLYPADVVDSKMAGVHVGIVTPKGGIKPGNDTRIIINVHGGGFAMGRGLVAGLAGSLPLASLMGVKVVTIDYRMAPYYQYPAASEDVETVYRELLKQYKPESIGIYGCSAGGVLTTQAVPWIRSKGLPRPGAVGVFCAAPAPYGRGDSSMWSTTGLLWNDDFMKSAMKSAMSGNSRTYMATASKDDPRANPWVSDEELAKFPPTLLVSGTRAPDMSPAIVSHAKFLKLGVDSQLYIMEGGVHGAFSTDAAVDTPEGRDTWAYIARWFDEKLAK